MLKHSGSATRLGADSPDERGGWERASASGANISSKVFLLQALRIPDHH